LNRRFRSVRHASLSLILAAACQAAPASRPSEAEPSRPPALEPAAAKAVVPRAPASDETKRVHVHAEGQLGPGSNTLFIDLLAPAGAKLTLESPLSVRGGGGIGLGFPKHLSGALGGHPMPLRLPIEVADGATGPAQVEVSYYWCSDGNAAACQREQARIDVELDLSGSGAGGEAHLSYRARGDRS
jgi:hypothetical protein